jgi:hypothetical protein
MFSFSRPPLLLTLGAFIGYGRTSSEVNFFPKELPKCAIDDVKSTDRAVRTESLLLPPHKRDISLQASLQVFPANGHPSPSILHYK